MIEDDYRARLPALRAAAEMLREFINELLQGFEGVTRVDIVTARAKQVESFLKKAENYTYPFEEIQDQVGVRVVVFFKSDIGSTREHLLKFFTSIEDKKAGVTQVVAKDKKGHTVEVETFGYEAWHCILGVPPDIQEATRVSIDFFELQHYSNMHGLKRRMTCPTRVLLPLLKKCGVKMLGLPPKPGVPTKSSIACSRSCRSTLSSVSA